MSALAVTPIFTPTRILDLGCGNGRTIDKIGWTVAPGDWVVGVDLNSPALHEAIHNFPRRHFISARGENLPFRNASFDVVLCNVALPYMDIPRVLAEISRVLVAGGKLYLKLHPLRFAMSQLAVALPHPVRSLFRCYVLMNGVIFHISAKTPLHFGTRMESFQTDRGMKMALTRAGFSRARFMHPEGKLIVEALRA